MVCFLTMFRRVLFLPVIIREELVRHVDSSERE